MKSLEINFIEEELFESEDFDDKFFDEIVYVGNEWLWCLIGIDDYLDFFIGVSSGESVVFLGIFIEGLFGEEKFLIR